jgi:hypothetical protein
MTITTDVQHVSGVTVESFPAAKFVTVTFTAGRDEKVRIYFSSIAEARDALVVDLGRRLAHAEVHSYPGIDPTVDDK